MNLSGIRISLAALVAALTLLAAGCSDSDGLPSNPQLNVRPGSSRQLWYFGYKSYDQTYRVRWPTYFATDLGVGPGSYTTINGQRADFRSFDTDHGAQRPSYTLSGPNGLFQGKILCILYSADGQALGWFRTTSDATEKQGPLP